MTTNEAIEIMHDVRNEKCADCGLYAFDICEGCETAEAFAEAIASLTVMTQMRPIAVNGHPDDVQICPRCGSTYIKRGADQIGMLHCNNCGQAIDWSVGND